MPIRHPPLPLLVATLALWALAFVAWTANELLLDPMQHELDLALRRLLLCLFGALLCLALAPPLRRARTRGHQLLAWVAGGVLGASALYASAEWLAIYRIRPLWGDAGWAHVTDTAMTVFWAFVAWVLMFLALAAEEDRRERELHLAQATALALDAQHRLLVQQLNPHFLFNALNTVYALVLEGDDERAQRSVLALSAFLRRSVDGTSSLQVPLADELAAVREYLDIELTRFGDRLRLVEMIPPALLLRPVPALILQPLVENAIKHGLAGAVQPVTIQLSAMAADGSWVLAVEDDGHGCAGEVKRGVGLDHVARRLALLYGATARLEARMRPGGGFVARLHLPESPP